MTRRSQSTSNTVRLPRRRCCWWTWAPRRTSRRSRAASCRVHSVGRLIADDGVVHVITVAVVDVAVAAAAAVVVVVVVIVVVVAVVPRGRPSSKLPIFASTWKRTLSRTHAGAKDTWSRTDDTKKMDTQVRGSSDATSGSRTNEIPPDKSVKWDTVTLLEEGRSVELWSDYPSGWR